jgi:aminoglycoside phosphotransferase (APT) family kinase protein
VRDDELAGALTDWISARVGRGVRLGQCVRPSSGMSNDTVLTEADWGEGARRIVVRLTPLSAGLFPRYDLGVQVEILRGLGAHTDVPVPRVLWWEPDPAPLGRPFYVMEHVEGRIPPDGHLFGGWVLELPVVDQARLIDNALGALARIHRVDVGAAGLDLLDRRDHGATPVEQELGWWRAYLEWAAAGDVLPSLDEAYERLADSRPPDADVARGLVWGDARLGNLVLDDALAPVAVLDWEMAVLGPPELDIGWYLFLDRTARQFAPQLPGFPDRAGFVAGYERHAGRVLRALAWWEAWSGFRTACIQVRMADTPEARERNPVTKALRAAMEDLESA